MLTSLVVLFEGTDFLRIVAWLRRIGCGPIKVLEKLSSGPVNSRDCYAKSGSYNAPLVRQRCVLEQRDS